MKHTYRLKGIYDHGEIRLLEKPEKEPYEQIEVEIIFPSHEDHFFSSDDLSPMNGIVSLGGDAFEDSENLYND